MILNLTRLRHVLAVARTGRFSVAAKEVGISQPALSRSIQSIEDHYSVRLFNRGKGGAVLTPAGHLAVDHARRILSTATDFDQRMLSFGEGKAGRTGVGMGPLMASMLLPRVGVRLLEHSPELTLYTHIGAPAKMMKDLYDGTIELIVANFGGWSISPHISYEIVGQVPLRIIVRAKHPLKSYKELQMSDLQGYPIAAAYNQRGLEPLNQANAFICENFDILRDVVMNTDRVWLVAPAFVKNELKEGSLRELDIKDLPTPRSETALVYLKGRPRSPACMLLSDAIASELREFGNQ